jgi:1-acyl-sn-glycerol-3-phosphate acyltransferase
MRPDRFQRPYFYIKGFARRALYLYFDRIQVEGYRESVPDEGALFFAANHQNTFLDPVIISAFSAKNRQPSFITRSDVFNKWTNILFKIVKMVPIYRQRDGGTEAIRRNEEMFKVYTERLKHEESMVIFPEGDHGRERRVRPLKKGLPRIAFQTLAECNFEIPFNVVPVGLYYRDHDKYHTDMLVVYGPPLDVYDYLETYRGNKNRGIIALRDDLQAAMEAVNVHIQAEHYHTVEGLRQIMGSEVARHGGQNQSLYQQFLAEKALIAQLEAAAAAGDADFEPLTAEVPSYQAALAEANLRDHVVAQAPHGPIDLLAQGVGLLFALPMFLYGFINHLPTYLILSNLPEKLLKDSIFYASVRYAAGLLIVPILYLLQTLLVGSLAGPWWALGYLLSLIPAGVLAKEYRDRAVKFFARWRFMRGWKEGTHPLRAQRDRIRARVMRILDRAEASAASASSLDEAADQQASAVRSS